MTPRDEERARRIRRWIRRGEERLVARFSILVHQDAIGAVLCAAAVSGMVGLGYLYWKDVIPAYVCILGNAFFASILHEIEHDLIHFLYFKRRPLAHNAMMFIVWAFRGNVPHGWYRRAIHFHHHRASGRESDVEERLLGLGAPWGFRRLLTSLDGFLAFVVNARRLQREIPAFRRFDLAMAALPFYPIFAVVLISFFVYHAELALGLTPTPVMEWLYPGVALLAVAWIFPNYLRQAALQIVSSNVHYYEDVRTIHQETQVLHPVFLWPLQLFCFNFGTTHAFHHYVVEQPFYIRQLIAPWVLPFLRREGVRENDVGTFRRANRWALS